ncbi:MAG TPA: tyrosine--tRNA ligase [Patescibacteria group bacterium]|nr:tyrosine--tRNA ligase [bacterium]HRY56601.1 tyrosine--tRNA ligase [Patescibacteria group bacterium]
MRNIYELLKERGYIATVEEQGIKKFQVTDEEAVSNLLTQGTTVYEGFDPSADSLHLGHFMSIMALHHMQEAGNRIIFILGGGTGRVGDPSGKNKARSLLTKEMVIKNATAIKNQVQSMGLLDLDNPKKALMIDNSDWLAKALFLDDYMMNVARYFSVNELVKMETFAKRLSEGAPLSLLEFLYATMQSWDYLELYEKYDCRLQVGGSDQWGNILQGVSLIKDHKGNKANAHALTFPLLTTANGEKMGKTVSGPLWLDPKKTSPFDFYQYIEKIPDDMVRKLFGLYTFIPMEEIDKIMAGNPRDAQKKLAFEVTKVVHGEEEAKNASKQSTMVFTGSSENLGSIPEFKLSNSMRLDEILVTSGSLVSNSEVARRVKGGAVKIDDQKATDPKQQINKPVLIKYGKTNFLKVVSS